MSDDTDAPVLTNRQRVAWLARYWVEDAIQRGENVIMLGDFNAEEPHSQTSRNGTVGILAGLNNNDSKDDLRDLHQFLPKENRATHLNGKQYDRILASRSLMMDEAGKKDFVFSRMSRPKSLVVKGRVDQTRRDGMYKIPIEERDASDHYPLVVEFRIR